MSLWFLLYQLYDANALQIGAPSELLVKLDDVTKKFERFDEADHTSKLGQDPELDFYMVRTFVWHLSSTWTKSQSNFCT